MTNSPNCIFENLRWLARGPGLNVLSYSGYSTNDYSFHTKIHDDRCTVQNSVATLVAQAIHISSAKDKNSVFITIILWFDRGHMGVRLHQILCSCVPV